VTSEPLSAEDERILRLESGTVHGHTCKVIVLAGRHGADAVRAELARRLDAVPRLRRRLGRDSGRLAWVDDPGFSLERQVTERGSADEAELRLLVANAMTQPLDRDRPLWAMDVVSPLDGARTAIIWRIHHALADGMTAMQMLRDLLLEPGEQPPPPPLRRVQPPPKPATAVREAARIPGTLKREFGQRAHSSPLDRPAGPRREVAFVDASLEDLKRVAHAAPERATVNDVVLTAVSGGLRAWLDALGGPHGRMRVKVPVSLHQSGEHDAANRDSFLLVDLPIEQDDPVERLLAVAHETRNCKRHHDAQTLDAFFRDLSHLSRSLERFAEHWAMSPRVFTLNVSNVPGPQGPQRVLRSELLELHSLAEIAHRHALRVAVVSAAGRISLGLCADPDAVGDLDVITHGIATELAALGAEPR
jgi:diacylglycerol O-acyltransferase